MDICKAGSVPKLPQPCKMRQIKGIASKGQGMEWQNGELSAVVVIALL